MHVDNGFVVFNSPNLLSTFCKDLCSIYDLKWTKNPLEHLGINFTRDQPSCSIHLSQETYRQRVLDRFGMENSNSVATPLHVSMRLVSATADDIAAHSSFPYGEVIGCLNHSAVHT